jgi:hypothetical protein
MPYFSEAERERGQQLLMLIHRGDLAPAIQLLSSGMTIDFHQVTSEYEHGVPGLTSLMLAAGHGFGQVILPLLRAGARPEAVDFKCRTALMMAAINAHPASVHILMQWRSADAVSPRAMHWLEFFRKVEVETAIAKLIEHVPNPSIQHASCALLLLHSVPSDALRLWSLFPALLKEQTHHLQEMLNSVKYIARTHACKRFFDWRKFAGLQLQTDSITRSIRAALGRQRIVLGASAKMHLLMHASLLQTLIIRHVLFVSWPLSVLMSIADLRHLLAARHSSVRYLILFNV